MSKLDRFHAFGDFPEAALLAVVNREELRAEEEWRNHFFGFAVRILGFVEAREVLRTRLSNVCAHLLPQDCVDDRGFFAGVNYAAIANFAAVRQISQRHSH